MNPFEEARKSAWEARATTRLEQLWERFIAAVIEEERKILEAQENDKEKENG